MKKPILAPAVLIISMMLFPPNASAAWLTFDIIKGLASGMIGGVIKVMKNDITTPAKNVAKPDTPSDEEILNALDRVETMCGKFADQGLPCAVGEGYSKLTNGKGKAKDNALADARKKLGASIETIVSQNRTEIYGQAENLDENENRKQSEGMTIADTTTIRVANVAVRGSQEYFTVLRYDGETYYATTIVVLNTALFEKALEKGVKGEPLSRQFITEGFQVIKEIAKKR